MLSVNMFQTQTDCMYPTNRFQADLQYSQELSFEKVGS